MAENLGLKGKPVLEVLLPFDRHNLRYGVISRRGLRGMVQNLRSLQIPMFEGLSTGALSCFVFQSIEEQRGVSGYWRLHGWMLQGGTGSLVVIRTQKLSFQSRSMI